MDGGGGELCVEPVGEGFHAVFFAALVAGDDQAQGIIGVLRVADVFVGLPLGDLATDDDVDVASESRPICFAPPCAPGSRPMFVQDRSGRPT